MAGCPRPGGSAAAAASRVANGVAGAIVVGVGVQAEVQSRACPGLDQRQRPWRGHRTGRHEGRQQVTAAADFVGLHPPAGDQAGQLVAVVEAERPEAGEGVAGIGAGCQGRVVAGQGVMGLAGEQIVHGGEHQVRRALPAAGVRRDGQQLSVAGDPGAEVGVQGRVVAAAALGEVPEGGGEFAGSGETRPRGQAWTRLFSPLLTKGGGVSDGR